MWGSLFIWERKETLHNLFPQFPISYFTYNIVPEFSTTFYILLQIHSFVGVK